MKHNNNIFSKVILVSAFVLFTLTASAQQFKKPITSPRDRILASDAKFNVGVTGGANFTTWLHFHSPEASTWMLKSYTPDPLHSIRYFGGISLEYMLNRGLSISFNAIYSQHNMALTYTDDHFPNDWDKETQELVFITRHKTFNARYRSLEAYVPITFYINAGMKNVKPYFYVAPRFSYTPAFLNDSTSLMTFHTAYVQDNSTNSQSVNSVGFNANTFQNFNVGLTAGIGAQFRINTANYYFLVKFDLSANMYALSTFTAADLENEFNHLRYTADAHASLTFQLPIKKRLKGACMNWGEYD